MLKEIEEKYNFLGEATNTGVVIIRGDGLVVDANTTYARLIGYENPEDILGKRVTEWIASHDKKRHDEEMKKCLEKGSCAIVVILDLTFRGGMGGEETIKRLLAIDPGIKAIVSSGYSDNNVVAEYEKYGFKARLTKPYKLEDLRDTLNKLLSA